MSWTNKEMNTERSVNTAHRQNVSTITDLPDLIMMYGVSVLMTAVKTGKKKELVKIVGTCTNATARFELCVYVIRRFVFHETWHGRRGN